MGAVQDVSGGAPVAVEGTDLPLWGMEVDPEQAKDELRASMAKDDGAGAKVLRESQPMRSHRVSATWLHPYAALPRSSIAHRLQPQQSGLLGLDGFRPHFVCCPRQQAP